MSTIASGLLQVRRQSRRGASFLEVQVAAIVMTIALSGLGPLMVLNVRQAVRFREQVQDTPINLRPAEGWRAKLGGVAAIDDGDPDTETFPAFICDDGDAGFETTGSPWYDYNSNRGYAKDFRLFYHKSYCPYGQYTMSVEPGVYQIYVTFPVYSFLSRDVGYRVYDDWSSQFNTKIDQRANHTDLVSEGKNWTLLGKAVCESGTIRVRVINHKNSWAMADAVQAVKVTNNVVLESVVKDRQAESISVVVSVDGEAQGKGEKLK